MKKLQINSLKSIGLNIFIPLLVSLVFGLLLFYEEKVPKLVFGIVPYLFYTLSAIILWVSWHFNRTKLIFIILPLLLVQLGFEYLSPRRATDLFLYVSILFGLHFLLFLSLRERGLFSIWGVFKIVVFALELAVVLYFVFYPSDTLLEMLKIKFFTFSLYPLQDSAVAVAVFTIVILFLLLFLNKHLLYNTSFLVIAVIFYLGLYFIKIPYAYKIALLSIAVIILILLIREFYRLAFYDELTSLPGRRALIEDMAKLGMKYSLAMIDIDHFKKFNDTYGHDTGDEVLKMVASKLAEVSGGGKAYRYGGEEFVLLFPSKDADESYKHTDILRQTIEKSPFVIRNKQSLKTIYINISSGVAQKKPEEKDPFEVMKRADNALYKAKKAGRNQVVKA